MTRCVVCSRYVDSDIRSPLDPAVPLFLVVAGHIDPRPVSIDFVFVRFLVSDFGCMRYIKSWSILDLGKYSFYVFQ